MEHSISLICDVIIIKRLGYYRESIKKERPRYKTNIKLLKMIRQIYEASGRRYGSPNIHREIIKKGYKVTRKRIESLMRKNNIRAELGKKRKYKRNTAECLKNAENCVKQNFDIKKKDKVIVSDITEIKSAEGKSYLCIMMDLYSRRIKSWKLSRRATGELVKECLIKAVKGVSEKEKLIFHTDKGTQYTSEEVMKTVELFGIRKSFSGKGNCYDNAPAESFFATLKKEEIYRNSYKTHKELELSLFKYIDIFYNKIRPHSNNAGLSPEEYEILNT